MAIITIFPGLSSKANHLILILLIVFSSAALLASITYVVAKGVHLFKEHQETEALVRKVWDTEARRRRIEDKEEEDEKYRKTSPNSLVPSLPPPVVIQVPPHNLERRYRYYFPAIPQAAAAFAPSFSYGGSLFIVGSRGQAVSPFHANSSNMIACVAPRRPPLPWADAIIEGHSGWGPGSVSNRSKRQTGGG
ncbi:hypothetical protein APHAL10511_005506 [Amanita phalloides]|nr:hypothetical protein APHAL10511_005506 [Amanita phalloides]